MFHLRACRHYCTVEPIAVANRSSSNSETIPTPDKSGLNLPEQPHWVEPTGPMRMAMHFYGQRPDDRRAHHKHTGPSAAPAAITA